jgi:hypothetical protein
MAFWLPQLPQVKHLPYLRRLPLSLQVKHRSPYKGLLRQVPVRNLASRDNSRVSSVKVSSIGLNS